MKKLFIAVISFLITAAIYSQSADSITKLIDTEEVTYGQVCYLTAVHNGLIDEKASETDAMNAWFENNQISNTNAETDTKIKYNDACFYLAKIWKIDGSLLFKLSKGSPRYAYKQFKKDGILPASSDPNHTLSGVDLLNIYTLGHIKYVGTLEAAE